MNRRDFFKGLGLSCIAGLTYGFGIEPHWLEIVRRPLPITGLPVALHGASLAHLSDIHVGPLVDDNYVIDTFRRVSDLKPDIVVFTGDFISHHSRVFEQAKNVFKKLPQGQLATVGILGNHDYGVHWAQPHVADELITTLQPYGLHMIRNEILDIAGLQILGFDDLWSKRIDAPRVMAAYHKEKPSIALIHNPDTADLPELMNYSGWLLAGHTHGGQCKPPFLPPPILPVKNLRYSAGEISLAKDRSLYINRGVGHLLPVRFNVRPEVALFTLQEI